MATLGRTGITQSDIISLREMFDLHDPPLAYNTMCLRWVGSDSDGYWVAFSQESTPSVVAYNSTGTWVEGDNE
jgi:hypothetical protein